MSATAVDSSAAFTTKKAVLFALLGFAGDVVVSDPGSFWLHEDICVHPSERTIVNNLVQFGQKLKVIEAFVQQNGLASETLCSAHIPTEGKALILRLDEPCGIGLETFSLVGCPMSRLYIWTRRYPRLFEQVHNGFAFLF